jgi:hypothetical protein
VDSERDLQVSVASIQLAHVTSLHRGAEPPSQGIRPHPQPRHLRYTRRPHSSGELPQKLQRVRSMSNLIQAPCLILLAIYYIYYLLIYLLRFYLLSPVPRPACTCLSSISTCPCAPYVPALSPFLYSLACSSSRLSPCSPVFVFPVT